MVASVAKSVVVTAPAPDMAVKFATDTPVPIPMASIRMPAVFAKSDSIIAHSIAWAVVTLAAA